MDQHSLHEKLNRMLRLPREAGTVEFKHMASRSCSDLMLV